MDTNPFIGLITIGVIIVGLWTVGYFMPVWDKCNGKGCVLTTGHILNSCQACGGLGYIDRQVYPTTTTTTRTTYQHDWRCYMGEAEKALKGRLWICHKCGDTTDATVPSQIIGCDVVGVPIDPENLVAAARRSKES